MSNITGSFTLGSNGTVNVSSLGFNPNDLEFMVGAQLDSSPLQMLSVGKVDENGNEFVMTTYDDYIGHHNNDTSSSYCIWHRAYGGGQWFDVLKASFNGYITGGFSLTVTAHHTDFPVHVMARQT